MEKIKNIQKMKDFLVIGLGRFGKAVATELYAKGNDVLAIDKEQQSVNDVDGKVSSAIIADATSMEVLHSLGARNFDCAIVCIGNSIESSLLIVQNCKELGVKYIIAKAHNEQHAKILNAIGVETVILPESFAGKKLANILNRSGLNELANLTDDFKIFEMIVPSTWDGLKVSELELEKKYKIAPMFLKRDEEILLSKDDLQLKDGDAIVLAGNASKIEDLISSIGSPEDINIILNSVFGQLDE